ncbi:hypothetical protein ACGF12_26175 [Kitasatospora sp. NPDC048296]|uniref:hypothetical protein n=1 Tax=Kitasatospora sp. NPDC048296 TaxID=3364048 RepID=UPI00371B15E1
MTTTLSRKRYEIRLINSRSPHFLLMECWGLWDPDQHQYLRVRGASGRIRRFYTQAAAEAYLHSVPDGPP